MQPRSPSKEPNRRVDVSAANHAGTNGVAIQLKGGLLPTSAAMTAISSKGLLTAVISNTKTYEDIVDSVAEYHSNALPATEYGRQLVKLQSIDQQISTWEGKHGPVTQAVVPRALLGLSDTDKRRQVLSNMRQQVVLESQAVKDQGHLAATAEHQADRAALTQHVTDALGTNDRRLRNSAEWILTAHKTQLFAITPTGDSYARLLRAGKDPAKDEAFFPPGTGGAGDITAAALTYNKNDLTDNSNINLYNNGKITGGWNNPGYVAVTKASSKSRDAIWEVIRHEVQHDADKHKGREAFAGLRQTGEAFDTLGITHKDIDDMVAGGAQQLATYQQLMLSLGGKPQVLAAVNAAKVEGARAMAEVNLSKYKTEYRAYSYQEGDMPGAYAALDNSVQNRPYGAHNFSERQLAIFRHIYDGYGHTKKGWDENVTLASGVTFQQAVVNYWNPDNEGANKYNSARIDDFYLALDQLGAKEALTGTETKHNLDAAPVSAAGKEHDVASVGVVALMNVAAQLTKEDANYLLHESPLYTNKINSHLDDPAKQQVIARITQIANS
ncbi:hypothetical protein [Chitinophaga sp. MM2321]|uniref:hypothetical protein n=1 Tax=Chitinophaga sp. MM2321 TaxID=3137178 RepID=UPI0032D56D7A